MKRLLFAYLFLVSILSASEKGLAVLYNESDRDKILVSLIHLHYNLESKLPVELWWSDSEMSEDALEDFKQLDFITLKKLPKGSVGDLFTILKLCSFEEVIWYKPNLVFTRDPAILFEDHWYKEKGAFFFNRVERRRKRGELKKNKKDVFVLRKLASDLRSSIDKIPYELTNKLYAKPMRIFLRYGLLLTDDSLLVINKKVHNSGIKKAVELSSQKYYSRLYQQDILWAAIIFSGKTFHLNFAKQVTLQVEGVKRDLEETRAQMYESELFSMTYTNLDLEKTISLVLPYSNVSRPLLHRERVNVFNFLETFNKI